MSGLLKRIGLWFSSKKTLSRQIAQVCAISLQEVGLSVGGNVFELKNSKNHAAWLVSLQMPRHVHIPAVDALALRLFLSQRVEAALGMPPRTLHMVLNFSTEAKRLPFPESVVEPKWLKARVSALLAGAGNSATSIPVQPTSPQPIAPPALATASPAAVSPKSTRQPLGQKPVSAPASIQEQQMKALLASLTDDDLYEVREASMTDFDRALQ